MGHGVSCDWEGWNEDTKANVRGVAVREPGQSRAVREGGWGGEGEGRKGGREGRGKRERDGPSTESLAIP